MTNFEICDAVSVEQTTNSIVQGSASGIMGLAFQGIAKTGAKPFWQTLADNNSLTSPEMSFWLNRFINVISATSATNERPNGGLMTFGGVNASLFTGQIEFLSMANADAPTFWLLKLTSACGHHPTSKIRFTSH